MHSSIDALLDTPVPYLPHLLLPGGVLGEGGGGQWNSIPSPEDRSGEDRSGWGGQRGVVGIALLTLRDPEDWYLSRFSAWPYDELVCANAYWDQVMEFLFIYLFIFMDRVFESSS
jgi:hypothetical protein